MRKTIECEVLTIKLEKKISHNVIKLCEETKLTKTVAVEKTLEKYIEEYKRTGKI